MSKSKKLSLVERLEIEILINKKYANRAIARVLHRSPNTISLEIKLNSTNGVYDAIKAHAKAKLKKKNSRFQWKKIIENDDLRNYIIKGLKADQNPDEISGRMWLEKQPFYISKTAIYEWLYDYRGQKYCKHLYSKRYHKKKREKNKAKRVMISNKVSIHERSAGANNRTRFGHMEKDAIVSGKKSKGSLAVGQERKSRLIVARKTKTMSSFEHAKTTEEMLSGLMVKSVTMDSGIENKNHKDLGVPTFFCDPYSPWQKGGVENANKMIRRYIPKGTNISKVPQEEIDRIVSIINNKPRKILGYRTALEVAMANGVLLTKQITRVS